YNHMKQLFALLTLTAVLNFTNTTSVYAQEAATEQTAEDSATQAQAEADAKAKAEADAKAKAEKEAQAADAATEDVVEEDLSFTQIIKQKFIEGGPGFMGIVLVCLILGLAIVIERIVYLNMATTNTNKLLKNIED